ncbi:unnamed protein product [Amaranthus hypochondriacus]
MELCTTTAAILTPSIPISFTNSSFPTTPLFRLPNTKLSNLSGVVSHTPIRRSTLLRATTDDEKSNVFTDDKSGVVASLEDDVNDVRLDTSAPVNTSMNDNDGVLLSETKQSGESSEVGESSSDDDTLQPVKELLNKLDIELDVEDTPTILLYGGGALVSVWLLSAIVGAIDSIPVVPKILEVVGLGYSVWFTTRYLLFKKSRDELGSKIEEIKREVLGSTDK